MQAKNTVKISLTESGKALIAYHKRELQEDKEAGLEESRVRIWYEDYLCPVKENPEVEDDDDSKESYVTGHVDLDAVENKDEDSDVDSDYTEEEYDEEEECEKEAEIDEKEQLSYSKYVDYNKEELEY